jgi:hypothetical protein
MKVLTLMSSKNSPCNNGAVLFLCPDFVLTFRVTGEGLGATMDEVAEEVEVEFA